MLHLNCPMTTDTLLSLPQQRQCHAQRSRQIAEHAMAGNSHEHGRNAGICEPQWLLSQEALAIKVEVAWHLLHHRLPVPTSHQVRPCSQEPRRVVERYAAGSGDEDSESGKAFVSLNWLLSEEHMDLETELAWGFLDYLLLGTSAAPLRKALNDSGLGEALIGKQGPTSCSRISDLEAMPAGSRYMMCYCPCKAHTH